MRKRDLIAAYKAAKQDADLQSYSDGTEAGREWATAEPVPYSELRNLAAFSSDLDYDEPENLAWIMAGRENGAGTVNAGDFYGTSKELWESALGDNWLNLICDPEFLRGFCEGALEVWAEVAPHLV